jgi:hypothetical protein
MYIIPGIFCALGYYNFFYRIYEIPNFSRELGNIIGIIYLIPYFIFYFMALTFTILLHPIIQIIIFCLVWRDKQISKICIIIIFIFSTAIAFIYLYLIWGKGLILTV